MKAPNHKDSMRQYRNKMYEIEDADHDVVSPFEMQFLRVTTRKYSPVDIWKAVNSNENVNNVIGCSFWDCFERMEC